MNSLQEQIRNAAKIAEAECTTGDFNAMTWLDDELENNPEYFDGLFETPWHQLSDDEKYNRMVAIRRVL